MSRMFPCLRDGCPMDFVRDNRKGLTVVSMEGLFPSWRFSYLLGGFDLLTKHLYAEQLSTDDSIVLISR